MVATVGIASAVIDQLTKSWAVAALSDGDIIDIVGSFRLRLAFNTGTAFSLGDGLNVGPFIAVLALAVVAYILWSGHTATRWGALAAGLVAGGAVGNLIDRAFRRGDGLFGGGVVDFLDLQWWPVFNVADACIVVGAILLVLVSAREATGPPAPPSASDR